MYSVGASLIGVGFAAVHVGSRARECRFAVRLMQMHATVYTAHVFRLTSGPG